MPTPETELQNQDGNTENSQNSGNEDTSTPEKKAFTQDELNTIVENRLSREREKYSDYDALRTFKTETEQSQLSEAERLGSRITELEPLASKSEERGVLLTSIYEDELNSIPEDKRTLIPEDFTVEQKLSFMRTNKHFFTDDKPVTTPNHGKPKEGTGKGYEGKYETLEEYAEKDPVGYMKFRQGNNQ